MGAEMIVIGLSVWVVIALAIGICIGKMIKRADDRHKQYQGRFGSMEA